MLHLFRALDLLLRVLSNFWNECSEYDSGENSQSRYSQRLNV